MNNKITKAEALMTKALAKAGVSIQGQLWLEHILDPFKDLPRQCEGFPDTNMSNSVVQVVKTSQVIATSSGTSTWDVNIFTDTSSIATQVYATTRTTGQAFLHAGQSATPYGRGGVNIRKATSGTDLTQDKTTTNVGLSTAYFTNRKARVIAQGFEVHNTTAVIDRQGSVCTWKVCGGSSKGIANLMEDDGVTACIPTSTEMLMPPDVPINLSEAILLPGSLQWEAEKGVYVVPVMISEENEPVEVQTTATHIIDDTNEYFSLIGTTGAAKKIYSAATAAPTVFSMSGAYFAGLSPETTLLLNMVTILEAFPDKDETDLNTLARPSAPYDPKVLAIYSKIAKKLPSGVEVRMNGLGDWVSGIASFIREAASLVGPVAGAIATGATWITQQDMAQRDHFYESMRERPQSSRPVQRGRLEIVDDYQPGRETGIQRAELQLGRQLPKNMPRAPNPPKRQVIIERVVEPKRKMPKLPSAPNKLRVIEEKSRTVNTNDWVTTKAGR